MKVGIIGGSGLYDINGLTGVKTKSVKTPFGAPSDSFVCGKIDGCDVVFLPRHGKGHRLLPSEINHRANIFALKTMGVERVVSISAVGSLKEELRPEDIVLPDQYFDRTKQSSQHTFFGNGVVAHVQFGHPTCADLRSIIAGVVTKAVGKLPAGKRPNVIGSGTYVNMEGPAFSTKAEANFHRKFGFDVIGMTSLAEAKLCREAEMCYQSIAMVTDYDCWREASEHVTVEMVMQHFKANIDLARAIIVDLVTALSVKPKCNCGSALKGAIMTSPDRIPAKTKKALKPIIGKYV